MDYANKSAYRREGSLSIVGAIILLLFVLGSAWFISTNAVRRLSGEPMLHEKAVKLLWSDPKVQGIQHCKVIRKGEWAKECTELTPEELDQLRVDYSVPTPAMLRGDF